MNEYKQLEEKMQKFKIGFQLKVQNLAETEEREATWLWKFRIPEFTLTIIEGDGGRGKSTLIADICARLSRGDLLPDDETVRTPKRILLLASEDDPQVVLKPRFKAHNAVLENIDFYDKSLVLDNEGLEKLRESIIKNKYDVVVIDPIVAFLGTKIDMNKGNDVRSVLGPLATLGRELACTIIVVRHFNKSRDASASHKGAGSVDFRNSARSVLQVNYNAEDGKTYLACEKSNYAVRAKTIPFEIQDSKIAWGNPCEVTAEELHTDSSINLEKSAKDEAIDFLKIELKTSMEASKILKLARDNGIAEKTLRRAAQGIGVLKKKLTHHWEWSLPNQDDQGGQ